MDDVKNQFKGLVKKFNNPFASSSRFKGEGHTLGSGQQPKTQPASQVDWRKLQQERWERERSHAQSSHPSGSTSSSPNPKPISEVSISDAFQAQKLDYSGDADPAKDVGSTPRKQAINPLKTPKLEDASISNSDGKVNSHYNEDPSPQMHGSRPSSTNPCVNLLGDEKSHLTDISTSNLDADGSTSKFDPFSSHIGSVSTSCQNDGFQTFQCPICGSWWKSEREINAHVDECLNQNALASSDSIEEASKKSGEEQTKVALSVLLSGGPSNETLNVFVRILRNIVNSPDNEKFRRLRLSNPKIHDTVGMALGGLELLEAVGFKYETEENEIWAVMDSLLIDQIQLMQWVITELESCIHGPSGEGSGTKLTTMVPPRKVDRQVRVFYAAPENLAAKIELPKSFYDLSATELKLEAMARKKKLEDSQLLISSSSRDKKAAAIKRRYKSTIIRIQFIDGVVLQGMFLPGEQTTALYEFVSTSLRDQTIRFSLIGPGPSKNQVIPGFVEDGMTKVPTLEEAGLVPAVLVKFKCAEADSATFTGLRPDLLAAMEPLSSTTLPL